MKITTYLRVLVVKFTLNKNGSSIMQGDILNKCYSDSESNIKTDYISKERNLFEVIIHENEQN